MGSLAAFWVEAAGPCVPRAPSTRVPPECQGGCDPATISGHQQAPVFVQGVWCPCSIGVQGGDVAVRPCEGSAGPPHSCAAGRTLCFPCCPGWASWALCLVWVLHPGPAWAERQGQGSGGSHHCLGTRGPWPGLAWASGSELLCAVLLCTWPVFPRADSVLREVLAVGGVLSCGHTGFCGRGARSQIRLWKLS